VGVATALLLTLRLLGAVVADEGFIDLDNATVRAERGQITAPHRLANTVRPILVTQVDRKSYLMTDESTVYIKTGEEYAGHGTVNHSIDEYVRAGAFMHTNTIESFFSLLKRGLHGSYHHVSQQHLKRYLAEFDFRYNARDTSDRERTDLALKGIEGKRLTYNQPQEAADA